MNDLIYRQDAIDTVSEACQEFLGIFGRCEDALKALPSVELKNDYKKALDCILAAYLNPEARYNILEKFVFETFSVGEEIKKEK